MLFQDKLSDIIRTLENDGLLLHPTDTVWSLACSVKSEKAIQRILYHIEKQEGLTHTLLIDSISRLKKYVPHIHPRIETLLHFHKKPLTVVFPKVKNLPNTIKDKSGNIAIRIVHDTYSKEIIKLLDEPLVSIPADLGNEQSSTHFADLPRIVIQNADFVSQHRQNQKVTSQISVMINYDEDGEIKFLRS